MIGIDTTRLLEEGPLLGISRICHRLRWEFAQVGLDVCYRGIAPHTLDNLRNLRGGKPRWQPQHMGAAW